MNNFWINVFRYPRFFFSSLLGLIFIILTPIKNVFKNPKLRISLTFGLILFLMSLYIIIKKMIVL